MSKKYATSNTSNNLQYNFQHSHQYTQGIAIVPTHACRVNKQRRDHKPKIFSIITSTTSKNNTQTTA